MDLVTQGVLGAAIGQGFFAKKLGNRAKWIGAILGLLPDADVLFTTNPIKAMYLHRGYTHSVPVTFLMGIGFGWLFWRHFHRERPHLLKHWIALGILALVTHPLLDVFTSYGTQLMLPFTNERYALDAVAVIDLFYTIPLLAVLVLGRFFSNNHYKITRVTLYATTLYLFVGVGLNHYVIKVAKAQLNPSESAKITSYPLLFQPFLRHVLCIDDNTVKSGFYSLVANNQIFFKDRYNPKSKLVDDLQLTPEAQIFYWFSNAKQTHYILDPSAEDLKRLYDQDAKATKLVRFTDARYVTLFSPFEGLWGIQALYDETGKRVSDVWYFRKFRNITPQSFQAFFLLIWEVAIHGPSPDDLQDIQLFRDIINDNDE